MALEDAKNEMDHAFTRNDLKGPSFELTFAGATSFLRRRYTKDWNGVAIAGTGVPFDQAVTNRPGTRLGPRAIREASSLQAPDAPYGWPFDVLSERVIVDYGDMAFDYPNAPALPDTLTAPVRAIFPPGAARLRPGGLPSLPFPDPPPPSAAHGAYPRNIASGGGQCRAGGRSLCLVPDPARLCRDLRADVADTDRCAYGHLG